MTPFNLRRRLIVMISRSLTPVPEEDLREDEEEDITNEVLNEPERFVFVPWMLKAAPAGSSVPQAEGLPASPTNRNGPPGSFWTLKVIDCNDQHDPAFDPEVQGLLAVGWEPFSVHKFHTITGVGGIRMYFKRAVSTRPEYRLPSEA